MSADRIIDPSTFSIPALALELRGHSIRFSLASNVYGSNMEFIVRVLTPPIPMGRMEQNAVYRFMRTGRTTKRRATSVEGLAVEGLAGAIVREMGILPTSDVPFSFQGRIIGEPGRPSPHSFLPDPCNLPAAQDKLKAIQLITLHTNFRSPAGYTGPVPRMGDIVKVSLDAGSQGPFSLQKASFKTLEMKKDPTAEAISTHGSCTSLSSLFSGGAPSANIQMNPAPTEAQKVSNHFIINVPMTGRYTSAYGVRRLAIYNNEPRPHWGIDIAAVEGTPILAPADGQRFQSGLQESDNGGAGHYVRTFHSYHTNPEHTDKSTNNKAIVFTYMHMKEATNLSSGQVFTRGFEIGKCGGTGLTPNGYGKHLHFEAYIFDVPPGSLNSAGGILPGKGVVGQPLHNKYLAAKRAKQDPIQVCRWDAHFSAGAGTAQVTTSQTSPPLSQD